MSAEKVPEVVAAPVIPAMPIPAFGDLGKAANDVREQHGIAKVSVLQSRS